MLLMTCYEAYKLLEAINMLGPGVQLNPRGYGMIGGVVLRFMLQLAVLFAVFTRKSGIRVPGAILALVFAAFQCVLMMSPTFRPENFTLVMMAITLRIIFGVCMLLPASNDYLDQ